MRWHVVVLILVPFLGSYERLRLLVMFHWNQKWRARSVKGEWRAESLAIFDHDNEVSHYIQGAAN